MLNELRNDLKKLANPEKAKFLMGFFKTGKGEYGEGDVFLGIVVPDSRKLAVKYKDLPLTDVTTLLQSKFHEERLIALLILVLKFSKGDASLKKKIYDFYLAHTRYINNWDLVDLSADKIVGEYLLAEGGGQRAKSLLTGLVRSESIWEKRIAMIATYAFIKRGEAEPALTVAELLLLNPSTGHSTVSSDRIGSGQMHDLIQKAVGWMLREVGKRVSQEVEEEFLKKHYKTMPRTALRYAIEHFSAEKRTQYLSGTI